MDLRVLRQDRRGAGAARNLGAENARGRILAFTDDDCQTRPGWLSAFARAVEQAPGTILGGKVFNALPRDSFAAASQLIVDMAYDFYNPDPESTLRFPLTQTRPRSRTAGTVSSTTRTSSCW